VGINIEHRFGKEAMVEQLILLELDFDEKYGFGRGGFGRQKHAIDSESGFFDFDGFKAIGLGLFWRQGDQFKEETGKSLEELVENGISAHGGEDKGQN
jgi:hypothetical protein